MFHPMTQATRERREREREYEIAERRQSFEANVRKAQVEYPQFTFPESLPEQDVLYLELPSPAGPQGYGPALSVNSSRIKFDPEF